MRISKGKYIVNVTFWLWESWEKVEQAIDNLIEEGYKIFSVQHILIGTYNTIYLVKRRQLK